MDKDRWRQIEFFYYAALEKSPDERADFLAEKCGDDIQLRDEINSLLNFNESNDDLLDEPDFELGLQILAKPDHLLQANQIFGNYKIISFLKSGGMGEVYLAQDERFERRVALKFLPRVVIEDKDRVRRFRQEARASSKIAHPNIARVYEAGEIEGIPFIAMEFVEGVTLRERLKTNSILPEEIIPIAEQIAAALEAAHASGVIHRDLKPENIMFGRDGVVKVLDFSLAKLTSRLSAPFPLIETKPSTFNTEPGIVMGTAAYMSPEQARGQTVDHRTDVWSFGVLLYEMLAGKPPFYGATLMDTIAAVLVADVPIFDSVEKSVRLRHIISKCLRKDRDERYQSANEILLDFKNQNLELNSFTENTNSIQSNLTNAQISQTTGDAFAAPTVSARFPAERARSPILESRSPFLYLAAAGVFLLITGIGWLSANPQFWKTKQAENSNNNARYQFLCSAQGGLISWYAADGNTNDGIGVNNGKLENGAAFADGKFGQGFSFDGNDDFFRAPTINFPTGKSDRTVELWVKFNSFNQAILSESFIAGYGKFGDLSKIFALTTVHTEASGDNILVSQWGESIYGPALETGKFYHVAATNTGDFVYLYLDGTLWAMKKMPIETPADTEFYIGRIPGELGDKRRVNGVVDEVKVYNRALSAEEIKFIYNEGDGINCRSVNNKEN